MALCSSGGGDAAGRPPWFWRDGPGRSSEEGWLRIAATHSSTWKCKKLFQEYLKNRSYSGREGGRERERERVSVL